MKKKYISLAGGLLNLREKRRRKTVLFCHIPRTAGSSLRRVIEYEYGEDERLAVYDDELNAKEPDPIVVESIRTRKKPYRIIYGHFSANVHSFF